jgi:hypothetical protein
MIEMVTCRRGPERQAGAARPDLVDAPTLPSAQPLKHLPAAGASPAVCAPPGRNSSATTCQAAGLGRGHAVRPVNTDTHLLPVAAQSCISSRSGASGHPPIGSWLFGPEEIPGARRRLSPTAFCNRLEDFSREACASPCWPACRCALCSARIHDRDGERRLFVAAQGRQAAIWHSYVKPLRTCFSGSGTRRGLSPVAG